MFARVANVLVFGCVLLVMSVACYEYRATAACSQQDCVEVNGWGAQQGGAKSCAVACRDNLCSTVDTSCLFCGPPPMPG